ncbi:MAG: hypothetical protein SGJ07_17815 [Rhodospirillaceae bacterium]|nr:hypothetical protein [Rhodospirillaceae bacterium]
MNRWISLSAYRRLVAGAALLIAGAGFAIAANAQETDASDEAVEQLSSDYTAIAGGWWLEQKCRKLAFEQKIAFEWNIGQLTDAITNELGAAWVAARQKSAKEIALELPCDDAAVSLIGDSVTLAHVVTDQLTGLVYEAGVTDRDYLTDRYASMAQGLAVADRCRYGTDASRAEFKTWIEQIGAALDQRYPGVNFPSLATDARLEIDAATVTCTPELDMRIQSFRAATRALGIDLGVIAPPQG